MSFNLSCVSLIAERYLVSNWENKGNGEAEMALTQVMGSTIRLILGSDGRNPPPSLSTHTHTEELSACRSLPRPQGAAEASPRQLETKGH